MKNFNQIICLATMRLFYLLLIATLMVSCDTPDNPCETGLGHRLTRTYGEARFDDRFDQIVIGLHKPGTIDSFKLYIPCNLPDSIQSGMKVIFDGIVAPIPDEFTPEIVKGGEEFFAIKLLSVNDLDL